MHEEKIISLLFAIMALFILMAVFFYKLLYQAKQINMTLEDIAKSHRIIANNPKDFEETKKVNALKNKSPYD